MYGISGPFGGGAALGSSANPFDTYSALVAAYPAGAAQDLYFSRLVGGGVVTCRWMSTRWAVMIDQVIANAVDPFSVVAAASTTAVDFLFATMPAGMFGDGETWVVDMPVETAANTGNDSHGMLIGGNLVDAASAPASTLSQCAFGLTRNGSMLRKTVAQSVAGLRTNMYFFGGINFVNPITIALRITPATIGNTSYIRRASLRRIA